MQKHIMGKKNHIYDNNGFLTKKIDVSLTHTVNKPGTVSIRRKITLFMKRLFAFARDCYIILPYSVMNIKWYNYIFKKSN